MDLDPEIVEKHIHFLAKRPGMYVSEVTFENVATHLEGYFMGLMALTDTKLFSSWRYWVAMKYGIWDCAWSWSRTIRSQTQNEEEAIKLLPILFDEFLQKYIKSSDNEIEGEHENFNYKSVT